MNRAQWMFGIGLVAVIALLAAVLLVLFEIRDDLEFIASTSTGEGQVVDTNMSGPGN